MIPHGLVYNPMDFHPEALEWLFKHFVFEDLIKKYKIAYMPDRHRVFMPLFDKDGKICYYITRGLIPGDKKYLTSTGMKPPLVTIENSSNQALVLVEDYISTIRLGQHYNVAFLQGTGLSRELLNYILENYTHVVTWLDSDMPGQAGARKIEQAIRAHELRMLETRIYARPDLQSPVKINNVCTELDPKCLTDEEISKILG